MWADHEAKEDLLGFGHLLGAVLGVIENDELLPATVGVFGDWGSGKSTLLNMVADSLKARNKDEGILVLQFNGWLFEGYDDAKAALMETIIDEIVAHQKLLPKAKKLALKLLRRVNWLRLVGKGIKYGAAWAAAGPLGATLVAGMDATKIIQGVGEQLEDTKDEEVEKLLADETASTLYKGIRQFREEFSTFLSESSVKRLVVIIDDLDRCLPSTVIETLEAIKLFLFAPSTAFVLGADERLVKYAVRLRFPELPGEQVEVGRDYLEKLIQYPVRVPALSRSEMTNYICHLLASTCELSEANKKALRDQALAGSALHLGEVFDFRKALANLEGCPSGLVEQVALGERLGPVLAAGLNGNPRQCKRFLNTLAMRLGMAVTRKVAVEPRVLAKLMLLEYFRPASFRRLAEMQAAENGKPSQIREAESQVAEQRAKLGGAASKIQPGEQSRDAEGAGGDENADQSATQDAGVNPWLEDPWLAAWVSMEPELGKADLRPYFYFSRDTLGAISAAAQRLTPKAQEFLDRLIQASDAVRKNVLKGATQLSEADAAAVFEELSMRMRREDNLGDGQSSLKRLLDWVQVRPELAGQLVVALGQLPEASVPFQAVPIFARITRGTTGEAAAKRQLAKWKESPIRNLSKAAEAALQPRTGR